MLGIAIGWWPLRAHGGWHFLNQQQACPHQPVSQEFFFSFSLSPILVMVLVQDSIGRISWIIDCSPSPVVADAAAGAYLVQRPGGRGFSLSSPCPPCSCKRPGAGQVLAIATPLARWTRCACAHLSPYSCPPELKISRNNIRPAVVITFLPPPLQ